MFNIVKTSAVRQKEAELKTIRKEHASAVRKLGKLKQKLADLQQVLLDFQYQIAALNGLMTELRQVRTRFRELLNQMQKNKKLSKADRKDIKGTLADLEDSDLDFFETMLQTTPEEAAQFAEENNESRQSRFDSMFAQFRPPVPEAEQQQIRKVYLRLAIQFHPDKTQNEAQSEQFHRMMQQINEAYAQNDLAALLELEQQYAQLDFSIPNAAESAILNLLNQHIERLKNELNLLTQQQNRTNDEIFNLKNSEPGQLIAESQKATKKGMPSHVDKIKIYFNDTIVILTKMTEGYAHYNEYGEFTSEFTHYMTTL